MQITIYKNLTRLLIALSAAFSFSSSADTSYIPAQFGNALNQLTAKVNLPEAFAGGHTTIAVYCQSDIAASGILSNTLCYENTGTANLEAQTLNALENAAFIPAQVDNQAVPVRMQYRVIYSRTGDQPAIVMLPNLGTLQGQHGYEYVAPQERLDEPSWFQKYSANHWARGKPFFNDGRLTRVIGTVKTDGTVASVSTLDAQGRGKRDADFIESALKQAQFIPGVVNGVITEMHYVAVLNYAR